MQQVQFPDTLTLNSQEVSGIQLLTSEISHICQEICDIKSRRKPKSNSVNQSYTSTLLDKGWTSQNYTRELNSNNSAKEGSNGEDGWGETCSSHSKLCHHEPNNPDIPLCHACQGHSTLSSQRVFEGARLTQLVQLVTAGRLFPCHKGQVDL